MGLVTRSYVQGTYIRRRIDGDRAHAEVLGGAGDATSDLAAIGDEDGTEHGGSIEHDPEKWSPVFGKDHAQQKDRA
jgi:hypothetical protein